MRPSRTRQWLGGRTPRSRGALVVGCALVLLGSVSAATPAVSAQADDAVALRATPWEAAAAEARILADRILRRESGDLLLDGERQRALGHEITRTLALIRQRHPAMAAIAVRREHRRATLLLGLKGALREAVAGTWHDGNASALPPTGHAAFDALNARLGLRAARSHAALGSVALHLDERANIDAARWAYLAIDGVTYAEPDALLVDGPDIEAAKVRDTWHVVFRKAWGELSGRLHIQGCCRSSPWRATGSSASRLRGRARWTRSRRCSRTGAGADRNRGQAAGRSKL